MSGFIASPRSSTPEVRRIPTRQLTAPWPFLYSVVPGRGLVKNLPSGSTTEPASRPRGRLIEQVSWPFE